MSPLSDTDPGSRPAREPDSGAAAPSVTCRLAIAARAARPGGFEALHARLSPSILAWARMPRHRHLRAVMDPDDLVQEVWIRASDHLASFDPARGTFRQWIFKIAKNLSIDLLRAYARSRDRGAPEPRGGSSTQGLAALPGAPSAWRDVARSEAFEAFLARVAALPDDDQTLLVGVGIEDLPVARVAQRLDISEAAAHKRWQRLRARLVAEGLPEGVIE